MPLSDRAARHILAVRKKTLAGRTRPVVLVSQQSTPTGMADPPAPVLADGGPGGAFPGGSVYAVCVARNAAGQTRAGAEATLGVAANRLVLITPQSQAGATSFDLYAGLSAGNEGFAGSSTAGVPVVLNGPPPAGSPAPYNSLTLVQAIFRHERGVNPADLDESGAGGDRRLMEVLIEMSIDVNLDGVTMVALTDTPTMAAVSAAEKFIFIDLVSTGVVPSGDRWLGMLRRIR